MLCARLLRGSAGRVGTLWGRCLSTPTALPAALSNYPRPTEPMDRAAFGEAFGVVCVKVLSAARAGSGAELDEARQGMAEAACRRAVYVADRWFSVMAKGADTVSPEAFDEGVLALLEGGDARAAMAFAALDADADGVISEAELREYLSSFNALYLDGRKALHLDEEAATNLRNFCEEFSDKLAVVLLTGGQGGTSKRPLTKSTWCSLLHGGQMVLIDSYDEHAGHCFEHMHSSTDRVIEEIILRQRRWDVLRLAAGTLTMGAVLGLFFV